MKLSDHTLKVLKNFSQINSNILIHPGQELQTLSNGENMMASASIEETFDQEVGIYDLNEFLSTLSLFKNPVLTFNGNSVDIEEENGRAKSRYVLADKSILRYPKNEIQFPEFDLSLTVNQQDLQQVLKAASAMSLEDIIFKVEDGKLVMRATDSQNSSSNAFDIEIDDWQNHSDQSTLEAKIKAENLKMMPGEYRLDISLKGISRFADNNQGLEYVVALEKE